MDYWKNEAAIRFWKLQSLKAQMQNIALPSRCVFINKSSDMHFRYNQDGCVSLHGMQTPRQMLKVVLKLPYQWVFEI
jgi:hypothetical protein